MHAVVMLSDVIYTVRSRLSHDPRHSLGRAAGRLRVPVLSRPEDRGKEGTLALAAHLPRRPTTTYYSTAATLHRCCGQGAAACLATGEEWRWGVSRTAPWNCPAAARSTVGAH
jgi:hypothetical protein